MRHTSALAVSIWLALGLLAAAPARAAEEGPVALAVNADDAAFSWARVERAVAESVGAPIVATDDPTARGRRGLLTVTWRPSRHELAVTYENARGVVSRVVAAPDDAEGAVGTAAALAANLVRDQAREVLGEAAPPALWPNAPTTPAPAKPPVHDAVIAQEEDVDAPKARATPTPKTDAPPSRLFFSVAVGTGFGRADGPLEVQADVPHASGLAPAALFHVEPEVGFHLASWVAVSLAARLQFIPETTDYYLPAGDTTDCGGDGVCSAPHSAVLGLARATFLPLSARHVLRPFIAAVVGVGQIRYAVDGQTICGATRTQRCIDTVLSGPFFTGASGGVRLRVAGPLELVGGAELLFPSFTLFNLDVNLGLAVEL